MRAIMTEQSQEGRRKRHSVIRMIAALAALAALIAGFVHFDVNTLTQQTLEWIDGLGIWAPALYILIYILACVFLIPGSLLTLGAGALFGVAKGSLLASFGATLGATCAFLVGRYLARGWVSKKIAGNPKFAVIDEAVADEGWKIVGLSRLSPIFPFVLLNYAFSLTRVSLRDYFLASWIGMIPGTVLYVYLGSLAGSLTALAASDKRERSTTEWVLYGIGLLATVIVTIFITQIARRALNEKIRASESPEDDARD